MQNTEVIEEFQREVCLGLIEILSQLVPSDSIKVVDAANIVKIAVQIRNDLTVEHGYYRTFLRELEVGIESVDDPGKGVEWYTFPGLAKMIRKDGGKDAVFHIVEPPKVELEQRVSDASHVS